MNSREKIIQVLEELQDAPDSELQFGFVPPVTIRFAAGQLTKRLPKDERQIAEFLAFARELLASLDPDPPDLQITGAPE